MWADGLKGAPGEGPLPHVAFTGADGGGEPVFDPAPRSPSCEAPPIKPPAEPMPNPLPDRPRKGDRPSCCGGGGGERREIAPLPIPPLPPNPCPAPSGRAGRTGIMGEWHVMGSWSSISPSPPRPGATSCLMAGKNTRLPHPGPR